MAFPGGTSLGPGFIGPSSNGLPLLTSTDTMGQFTGLGLGLGQPSGLGLSQGLDQRPVTHLNQETELQKMLTDERMRGEMHKTNYQMIKAEHTKLQDENSRLQRELEQVTADCQVMEERLQEGVNKINRELAIKCAELEEFRAQALTLDKLELIKLKIAEDLEQPFRERFTQLEQDVEHYRTEFNKLRYENSFIKSEYEHEQAEHKRVVEEIKMQYETEIKNLHRDKEAIVAKYSQENSHDSDKVRTLYRDNAQLNLKVKGLLTELDEIRAQREQSGLQSDHVSRLQARQLSEHATNIKALQSEKESLQLHMEQLTKELGLSQDTHRSLTTKTHDLEKQNMELRSRMEETLHRNKMEITDLKMAAMKTGGELEREKDGLVNELEGLKAKHEVLEKSLDAQTNAVADKEREVARKVQSVREEEWERINKLEGEKLELEGRLQEFERLKIDEESQRYADKENGQERIREAEKRCEQAERDLQLIKTKLEHHNTSLKDLEHEQTISTQLREKCTRLKAELQDTHAAEQELLMENDNIKASLEMYQNELVLAKAAMEKESELSNQRLSQHKMTWLDEKTQLERRLDEREGQARQAHKQRDDTTNAHAKRKQKYQKVVNKLQDKMQLLEAKNEQLELEKQALKNQIPKETYTKAVRKLRELQRRHNEFRNVLSSANVSQVPLGGVSFMTPSMTQPLDASSPFKTTQPIRFQIPQIQIHPVSTNKMGHHHDLSVIRSRLEELSDNQRLQMDALLGGVGGGGGGMGSVPLTARSEMDKENEDRALSPEGSGMDVLDL
ncbi:centrosomal protein of 83 kDa-like isoform X2 [Strongylocentrotus purpuratus]|nr:centrosomal protein of 83 kDa-like isoform X2 [Strongylocentrotus purpuratus]